jgi:hypothetical protein
MPDNDAPLTSADLRAYLNAQDDFAFERRVFTHAKGFGLTVQHAGLYEDPATSKRQFDLRASKEHGDYRIKLAIECKSLRPSYPLLVSCVPRSPSESYHNVMFGFTGSTFSSASNAGIRPMRTALYAPNHYVGKDMSQVGRKGDGFVGTDEKTFEKYQQAMASSADLIAEAAEFHRPRRTTEHVTAILPILVVPDATLWEARYSSSGQLEADPQPTDEVTFFLGRRYFVESLALDFIITHLHIMTETTVAGFLQRIGQPQPGGIWDLLFQVPQ